MRSLAYLFLLGVAGFGTSACGFYLGGDDDDPCDDVYDGAGEQADIAALLIRNPDTGVCEDWSSDWYPCDSVCGGPCPEPADTAPVPTWGACDGTCEALDEASCLTTEGCRAGYTNVCDGDPDCVADSQPSFHQCWSVDQTGPVRGSCDGLGAYECSRHDDCIALHDPGLDAGIGRFQMCAPEPDAPAGCYGDEDCGDRERCNASEICLPPPGCDEGEACPAVCYGYCVPDSEPDPGECYGEVYCDVVEPACPDGTLPGVEDGCYTGYCIPIAECEDPPPPPPACETLSDESACIERADCSPLYEGVDCTCDGGGCTCADWTFVSCN